MKKSIFTMLITVIFLTFAGCSLLDNNTTSDSLADNGTIGVTVATQTETISERANVQSTDTQPVNSKMIKVSLYFVTDDNSALKEEKREVNVIDGAIMKACMQALLEGPDTNTLHKTIPDGTKLIGVNRKDNVAIVDFSKEYNSTNDIGEVLERVSIVNTLTGISGIDKAIIRVEGKELIGPSGKPFGEMGKVSLDSNGKPETEGD
jgi:Spore germination protein